MYYVYIPTYVGVLGFGVRGSRQIFFARYTWSSVKVTHLCQKNHEFQHRIILVLSGAVVKHTV